MFQLEKDFLQDNLMSERQCIFNVSMLTTTGVSYISTHYLFSILMYKSDSIGSNIANLKDFNFKTNREFFYFFFILLITSQFYLFRYGSLMYLNILSHFPTQTRSHIHIHTYTHIYAGHVNMYCCLVEGVVE